jgi:CPA2 family monovalent cation:H+ antiporter-2
MAALLYELGLALVVITVAGVVASKLRQSVVPIYLLVGVLVGPFAPEVGGYSLSLISDGSTIYTVLELFGTLGIVFLLFFIGLEFNFERLLASRERIVSAGVIDFGINFGIGLVLGFALGLSLITSFFLAGVVYISSSAVITKTLLDLGWIADPESEAILGVLVFEDIVIAVYLALLGAIVLGSGGSGGVLVALGTAGIFLVGLVALAAVGTPLLERAYDVKSDERFLLQVVAAAIFVAGLATQFGVSDAVAAFFLGAAFGGTSHAERIERVITSERDLYAAVFFFVIGLGTDFSVIIENIEVVALLAVVTAASKLVSGYYSGKAFGLSERRSTRVAAAMVTRGEFSLVIAALAAMPSAPPEVRATIPPLTVGYVLVMSVLGTVLMRQSGAVERVFAWRPGQSA